MKKAVFTFLVVLALNNLQARNTNTIYTNSNGASVGLLQASVSGDKTVKTKPEKVIVYIQGAQVYRTTQVQLVKGDNYIVFENLENNIDPASIQAGGTGNSIITEIQHVIKYPELEKSKITGDTKFQKLIKQITDSLELVQYMSEDAQNRMEVLETERNVLLNYSLYKGTSKKDSIAFLKEGMSFLREKLNNIYTEILKVKKEQASINRLNERLNLRLQEANNEIGKAAWISDDKNKPDYRISITISADAPGTANISLNYYMTNAGWTPFYDLRTNGADKGVLLTYKAHVKQLSGVDWDNVKLTLSTGNPKQNFTIPDLLAWYVDDNYTNPKKIHAHKPTVVNSSSNLSMVAVPGAMGYDFTTKGPETLQEEKDIQFTYEYTEVDQNMIQAEFEIKLPYTIPSDNKNHMVSVSQKELATKYIYKCVPKADLTAFLTARIAGWEDMNLLPGTATVYFDGTYVGQTMLYTGVVSDTLELSLGQDKNVSVKRVKSKDKTKEKLIDNDKIYTYVYDIHVRNGNAKAIEIEVIDQLPMSRNKNVVVERLDLDGGEVDEVTGKIVWRETLKAKDNKKICFGFTIKAPKDMPVAIR